MAKPKYSTELKMPSSIYNSPNWGFDMEQKRNDEREQLRQYFLSLKPEEQDRGWDDMWKKEITPWDRSQPNPALVEALQTKTNIFDSPFTDAEKRTVRRRALVPGCGRGYDVLLLSSYGYDAVGVDASSKGIEMARKLLADQGKEQHYPVKNIQDGRGEVKFIVCDFFADDFLSETHGKINSDRTFDLIYDYTFLCALPPQFRTRWAKRMSELLSPTGHLVCMEFPLGKNPKLGGPPHGLESVLYQQLLAKPGQEVNYNDSGHVCEDRSGDKADNGLARVEHWKPERTFEEQRAQLMVSIWQHWKT